VETLIEIVIYSLIVYRIATDITEFDGAFEMFAYLRGLSMKRGVPSWIAEGLHCAICVSFWLTIFLVIWMQDIRYFAVAGIVTIIVRWLNKGE
jgi:hypothetical protein